MAGQADGLFLQLFFHAGSPVSVSAQQSLLRFLIQRGYKNGRSPHGTHNVHMLFPQMPFSMLWIVFHLSIGLPCRKMFIIQQPHLHVSLLGFLQQDSHIGPPVRLAEVLIGPSLNAEGADAAILDVLHLLR